MTCEVALLNRRAVALAADSATTVSYWRGGERKERYFKGTNKLFNLSAHHPVGLMTFDTGTLQGVPWEILVKAYRDAKGDKSHPNLFAYGPDLFRYIQSNQNIYTPDFQKRQLISDLTDTAARLVYLVSTRKSVRNEQEPAKKAAAIRSALEALGKNIAGAKFIGRLSKAASEKICAEHLASIIPALTERTYIGGTVATDDLELLAKLAALAITKHGYSSLDTTGIVIAGYGEKEFFPCLKQFTVYGLVLGKLIFEN
jgi:hypothetical protein